MFLRHVSNDFICKLRLKFSSSFHLLASSRGRNPKKRLRMTMRLAERILCASTVSMLALLELVRSSCVAASLQYLWGLVNS